MSTHKPIHCLNCGYVLDGTRVDGACPECGLPVRSLFEMQRVSVGAIAAFICACLGVLGIAAGGLPGAIFGAIALMLSRHERLEGAVPTSLHAGSWLRATEALGVVALVGGVVAFALLFLPWLMAM